jgi:hypothetical protein
MEGGEAGTEQAETFGGDAVGAPAVVGGEGLDPAALLEASDGAVEGAGAETGAAEAGDVVDHGVAVFGAVGEGGENEERGIGVVAELGAGIGSCYVARTTHGVVIARKLREMQEKTPKLSFAEAAAGVGSLKTGESMVARRFACPKTMRACPGPGTCPGCRVHAALQSRDGEELRKRLMVLWEGKPLRATSYRELMRLLGVSETEARELEFQEQLLVDEEVARFPKQVQ